MSSFDNVQVEDLSALEAYETSLDQAIQEELLNQWWEDKVEEANAELQCLAN
jgi:hypothetical protein